MNNFLFAELVVVIIIFMILVPDNRAIDQSIVIVSFAMICYLTRARTCTCTCTQTQTIQLCFFIQVQNLRFRNTIGISSVHCYHLQFYENKKAIAFDHDNIAEDLQCYSRRNTSKLPCHEIFFWMLCARMNAETKSAS